MSQHPSLRSSAKDKKHRSVLKRYERVKLLKEKDKWKDDDSVLGLQKVKVIKFKVKKEKAAAAETTETQETVAGAPAAGPQAAQQAKTASPAKAQSGDAKK